MATNGSGDALSGLEKKIIRQVEYYFGDINLPRDKFLLEQIKENEDGWVPMETMVKFNRLKELSQDFDVIANSLKKSASGLIEVSEDSKKMRRNPEKPMPENTAERRQELTDKTLYVKSFPLDVTLDRLMEFFEGHGNVEGMLMRKDIKKKFKVGNYLHIWVLRLDMFVKLNLIGTMGPGIVDSKALIQDKKSGIVDSKALIQESQTLAEFMLAKTPRDNSYELWKIVHNNHKEQFLNFFELAKLAMHMLLQTADCESGFSAQNNIHTQGSVFLTFKNKEDAEKFVKAESVKFEDTELVKKFKKDYYAEKDDQKKQKRMEQQKIKEEANKKKQEGAKEKIKSQLTEGAVLHIKGLKKETQRDDIKNFFQDHGTVAWVNFNKGDEEASVRFSEKNAAKDALEKVKNADGKIVLNDAELECRVLEGEEEFTYWENAFKEMAERRESKKRKGGNKGRQGRFGGRKGYMGKKNRSKKRHSDNEEEDGGGDDGDGDEDNVNDEDGDEPPAKQIKVE